MSENKPHFEKKKPRVLVVGDAAYPLTNTGFAIVLGQVIPAFVAAGWDVVHFARLLREVPSDTPNYRIYLPPAGDMNGFGYIDQICQWEQPDLIFINADPGSIMEFRRNVEVRRIPNLVYTPTEGAPLLSPWSDTMQEIIWMNGQVTTYTEFSRAAIEANLKEPPKRPVEVLPHGVDHAPFRRYDKGERARLRQHLGWTDSFVVMNVARNAGRKMWVRLLDAVDLARKQNPRIKLYAHTVAFENYALSGHNLLEIRRDLKLEGFVQFHSEMRDGSKGISYNGIGQGENRVGLIDLYNAADIFVSTSGAEGWNLPLTEAAACGLPCVAPMYSGAWEVCRDWACGIPVDNYETHSTGLRYAAVKPETVSDLILQLAQDSARRDKMSANALKGARALKWQPTAQRLVELSKELVAK